MDNWNIKHDMTVNNTLLANVSYKNWNDFTFFVNAAAFFIIFFYNFLNCYLPFKILLFLWFIQSTVLRQMLLKF